MCLQFTTTQFHIQCTNISKNEFRQHTFSNWTCVDCTNMLPFNHLPDNDEFIKAVQSHGHRIQNMENLIFSPFDCDEGNIGLPMYDIDPDFHFYSGSIRNKCNSEYYDDCGFNELINKNSCYRTTNSISMYHINIRSLPKNIDKLVCHLHSIICKIDIIAINENWLTESTKDPNFLEGYQHVYMYRHNRKGGGVSLFIRNALEYEKISDYCITHEFQHHYIIISASLYVVFTTLQTLV